MDAPRSAGDSAPMPDPNNPYSTGIDTRPPRARTNPWPLKPTVALLILSAFTTLVAIYQLAEWEISHRALLYKERAVLEQHDIPIEGSAYEKLASAVSFYRMINWLAYAPVATLNTLYFAILLRIARTIERPRRIALLYVFSAPILSPGIVLGIPFAVYAIRHLRRTVEIEHLRLSPHK